MFPPKKDEKEKKGEPEMAVEIEIEPSPEAGMSEEDSAEEPSETPGSDKAADAEGTSGQPGALIAEKLGVSPEEGAKMLDAAKVLPGLKDLDEAAIADKLDKDLQLLMRVQSVMAKGDNLVKPGESMMTFNGGEPMPPPMDMGDSGGPL